MIWYYSMSLDLVLIQKKVVRLQYLSLSSSVKKGLS